MKFTYNAYKELINLLKEKNYHFSNYFDSNKSNKTVIFRHDVDYSLEKALDIAILEKEMGISSTYFVLITGDFYNVFSKRSYEVLRDIQDLNHNIGLHFDEKRYNISNEKELNKYILKEKILLESLLDKEVKTVSMHRPSKWVLEANSEFEGILNTYSKEFFIDFKYVSDSRMKWKEDVFKIIKNEEYSHLHILTHPFWYEESEKTMKEKIMKFIRSASLERYLTQKANFSNLEEIIKEADLNNEFKSK